MKKIKEKKSRKKRKQKKIATHYRDISFHAA